MSPFRRSFAAALALLALAGVASAEPRRRFAFSGSDVRFAMTSSAESAASPVTRAWSESGVGSVEGSIVETTEAVCRESNARYWKTVGEWLAAHTDEPRPGGVARALLGAIDNIRYEVANVERAVARQPKHTYLDSNDRFDKAPRTSSEDLRQRSEWIAVLEGVASALAVKHEADPKDFDKAFAYALWVRGRCDLRDETRTALSAALDDEALGAQLLASPNAIKALNRLVEEVGDPVLSQRAAALSARP